MGVSRQSPRGRKWTVPMSAPRTDSDVPPAVQGAIERLESAGGELVLDFSSVRRLDAGGLRAMEALAGRAEDKKIRVILGGVNVEIYRVLKLVKLSSRFSFRT